MAGKSLTENQLYRRYGIILEPLPNGRYRWTDVNDTWLDGSEPTFKNKGDAMKSQEEYIATGIPRRIDNKAKP